MAKTRNPNSVGNYKWRKDGRCHLSGLWISVSDLKIESTPWSQTAPFFMRKIIKII